MILTTLLTLYWSYFLLLWIYDMFPLKDPKLNAHLVHESKYHLLLILLTEGNPYICRFSISLTCIQNERFT